MTPFNERPSDEDRKQLITLGLPKSVHQFLAGLFALPVERYSRHISHPIIIFSFITAFVGIHLFSINLGSSEFVYSWAFIPEQYYRHGFITLISSFFLHASWAHLVGNAYYFYIFGDDVEDELGFTQFLILLFGGHVAGILLQAKFGGDPSIPILGASAGISALQGFYMVYFPKRQITYMLLFFYVWIHVPAAISFLWKFGWEFVMATKVGTATGIAFWAHIGGALFGIVLGLIKLIVSKSK